MIIIGDFNEHVATITQWAAKSGLAPAVAAGTPTHCKGGHLDQVFSNLSIEELLIGEAVEALTDHLPIKLTIRLKRTDQDVDIRSLPVART